MLFWTYDYFFFITIILYSQVTRETFFGSPFWYGWSLYVGGFLITPHRYNLIAVITNPEVHRPPFLESTQSTFISSVSLFNTKLSEWAGSARQRLYCKSFHILGSMNLYGRSHILIFTNLSLNLSIVDTVYNHCLEIMVVSRSARKVA